ncbi:MAG: sigma-54-dependent Fis family transcriptional regulator [Planctomycetales bacterium]|nr:sigma-54-dependent Fis family transcriptional regulator [Planctomycetales bacterium]
MHLNSDMLLISSDQGLIQALTEHATKRGHRLRLLQVLDEIDSSDATSQPAIVFLDLQWLEESGSQFSCLRSRMPDVPWIVIGNGASIHVAIEAMQNGAFECLVKPFSQDSIRGVIERALSIPKLVDEGVQLTLAAQEEGAKELVGRSMAMCRVFKDIALAASQDFVVLIRGESGTGKEIVARTVVSNGLRRKNVYSAINCSAIPADLLESELFGHEAGAFTSADRRRIGRFEYCDQGTLFLDEIGDMPPLLQCKVLRVLQEQQFERLGSNELITTNVRVISATHRPLERMVAEGRFREDLYYRLNNYTIVIPPLRERLEDVQPLLEHYLAETQRLRAGPKIDRITEEALDVLHSYPWPGNVRELAAAVRHAVVSTSGLVIGLDSLPEAIRGHAQQSVVARGFDCLDYECSPYGDPDATGDSEDALVAGGTIDVAKLVQEGLAAQSPTLHQDIMQLVEKELLVYALKQTHGNQTQAAKLLGITRGKISERIKRFKLAEE